MYGLVNRAIVDFAIKQGGTEAWDKIQARSGIGATKFLSMETYPDHITYDVIAAAAEVFDLPAASILREFGRFWVSYVAKEGYGSLLSMLGTNLQEALGNLDSLHLRVLAGMPHLNPPSFKVEPVASGGAFRLYYRSTRPGLLPMVIGLVESLAESFQQSVNVSIDQCIDDGDAQVLLISVSDAQGIEPRIGAGATGE